jgi:hypothetical protein
MIVATAAIPALAASLDGMSIVETAVIDERVLQANGLALRTWTLPFVHDYLADFYLVEPACLAYMHAIDDHSAQYEYRRRGISAHMVWSRLGLSLPFTKPLIPDQKID